MMSQANHNPTQAQRRARYGLNVTVAVFAALGVVILLNLLAFGYLKKVNPIDLTASGQYSLSPQTRQVLSQLQAEHEIVTLLGSADPELDRAEILRARDLVDQYARYSPKLKVEHISADVQASRVESFLTRLHGRYQQRLVGLKQSLEQAQQHLSGLREPIAQQRALLVATATDPSLADDTLKQFLTLASQTFSRLDSDLESLNQQVAKSLTGAMPDYTAAHNAIEEVLQRLDERFYRPMMAETQRAAQSDTLSSSIKERLLTLTERFSQTREMLQASLLHLRTVKPVEEYDQIRQQILTHPNPIVITGPENVRVLWLSRMFRRGTTADPNQMDGERAERLFQGEEHLTGALMAMQMKSKPLVVFIATGQRPATGPGGEYSLVAERLQTLDYIVRSWNPGGQMMAMGQTTPPSPPPLPEPGQPVVWILTASEQAGPMGFMMSPGEEMAANFLKERMDRHQEPVMFILGASMGQRFGQVSPVPALLEPYGLSVKTDQVVFREFTGPDGRVRAQAQFQLSDWPSGLPITQAIAGLRGLFLQTSPIQILEPGADTAQNKSPRQIWPLAEITGRDIWADTQFDRFPDIRRDPAKAANQYVVAAAVQQNQQRLAVFADPAWATDAVVDYGRLGPGTARLVGAAFPANAELFINTVQWLAGLENLIAASARTQDIRRVMALTELQRATIQWGLLAGLPLLVILAGIAVGLLRRRT